MKNRRMTRIVTMAQAFILSYQLLEICIGWAHLVMHATKGGL